MPVSNTQHIGQLHIYVFITMYCKNVPSRVLRDALNYRQDNKSRSNLNPRFIGLNNHIKFSPRTYNQSSYTFCALLTVLVQVPFQKALDSIIKQLHIFIVFMPQWKEWVYCIRIVIILAHKVYYLMRLMANFVLQNCAQHFNVSLKG